MKRTVIVIILCTLLAASVAFGCAANNAAKDEVYYGGYADISDSYYEPDMPDAPMAEAETGIEGKTATAALETPLSNRKIIRNAEISAQTLEFDAFVENLTAAVNEIGGFIESSEIGGRTIYNQTRLRNAYFVIRVPAAKLDAFLNTVDGLGNVTSKSTGLRDVTTSYVDSEKHLEALRTEQTALLEILKNATTVEDIITVQDRLSEVSYEIESDESILRTFDDQIDLSTVRLNLSEVERETIVEEETFGQEVSRRFKESLEDVGDGFKAFGAWLFGNAPQIIVFLLVNGGIALIIIFSIRGGVKRRAKRRAKKLEQQNKEA